MDAVVSTDVLAGCHPKRHLWHISCCLTENFHTVIVKFLVPERIFIETVPYILLRCVGVRAPGEAGPERLVKQRAEFNCKVGIACQDYL